MAALWTPRQQLCFDRSSATTLLALQPQLYTRTPVTVAPVVHADEIVVCVCCRSEWCGSEHFSLNKLKVAKHRLQDVVGADVSFEEFEAQSADDLAAAVAQLNARLAAKGAHHQDGRRERELFARLP